MLEPRPPDREDGGGASSSSSCAVQQVGIIEIDGASETDDVACLAHEKKRGQIAEDSGGVAADLDGTER